MHILLVKPDPIGKRAFARRNCACLTLQILSALTPQKHFIDTIDESYQTINFDKKYDLVGITCMTYDVVRGYEIADEFRRRGIKVVLGGWHPSVMPKEAKQHADGVVIGEAEIIWPRLLKDLDEGNLKEFYKQETPIDPKLIPKARRDVTKDKSNTAGIEASRGCPIGCDFCAISNKVGGNIFRPRPIEDIIDEIKSIKQKNLFFYSPSMTIDPKYTKTLFSEMIGLNKKFSGYGHLNVLGRDQELLKLAKKAGCVGWTVGFESISQETIDNIGKSSNKVSDYKSSLKNIYNNGMIVRGAFVFGFDDDKLDVFDNTLKFIYDVKLNTIVISILTPLPGTPLYDRMNAQDRILSKNWSLYDFHHVVFKPKNMTAEQLYLESNRIANDFFKFKNTIKAVFRSSKIKFIKIFK